MGTIQNKHHSTESSKNAQNTETQGLFYKEPLMLHRGSSHMKKSVATTHPTSLTKILYKKKVQIYHVLSQKYIDKHHEFTAHLTLSSH
jgi:hypothetical protein